MKCLVELKEDMSNFSKFLKAMNLSAMVSGLPGNAFVDDAVYNTMSREDKKWASILMIIATKEHVHRISDQLLENEACAAMKALRQEIYGADAASTVILSRKIESTTFPTPTTELAVHEVCREIEHLREELRELSPSAVPNEASIVSKLLMQAREANLLRFGPVAHAMISGQSTDLTLSKFKLSILSAIRTSNGPEDADNNPQSIAMTTEDKRFKGECWNCGTIGHRSFECKNPKNNQSGRNKKKGGRGRGHGPTKANISIAMTTVLRIGDEANQIHSGPTHIVLDTDASGCHVTRHLETLKNYTPVQGKKPKIGSFAADTSCDVEGYGEWHLTLADGRTQVFTKVAYVPSGAASLLSVSTSIAACERNGLKGVYYE